MKKDNRKGFKGLIVGKLAQNNVHKCELIYKDILPNFQRKIDPKEN